MNLDLFIIMILAQQNFRIILELTILDCVKQVGLHTIQLKYG